MAETARKRFDISEKSVKNGIYSCPPLEPLLYSCPPLEPLPNKNIPVDCFCSAESKGRGIKDKYDI